MDLHQRDGSLLRKKQEKWIREKEDESKQRDWFPFGENNSPGGGNPNRKHEAREYTGNANGNNYKYTGNGSITRGGSVDDDVYERGRSPVKKAIHTRSVSASATDVKQYESQQPHTIQSIQGNGSFVEEQVFDSPIMEDMAAVREELIIFLHKDPVPEPPCPAELYLESIRMMTERISGLTNQAEDHPECTQPPRTCEVSQKSSQQSTSPHGHTYGHTHFFPYAYPVPADYSQAFQHGQHRFHVNAPPIPVPFHLIPPTAIPIGAPAVSTSQNATSDSHQSARCYDYLPQYWSPDMLPGAVPIYPITTGAQVPTAANLLMTSSTRSVQINTSHDQHHTSGQESAHCPVPATPPIAAYRQEEQFFRQDTAESSYSAGGRPRAYSNMSDVSYEEQIEERRRREMREMEREQRESERIEREREEQERNRQREIEENREAELRKQREKERAQEQLLESIEKAKREAELMRKAKLYKHVLATASPEMEKRILGVDDASEGDRILKEVTAFERQRQREFETLRINRTPSKGGGEGGGKPKRSMSVSSGDDRPIMPADSPLQRNTRGRMSLHTRPPKPQQITQRSNSAERKSVPATPLSITSRIPRATRQTSMPPTQTPNNERSEPREVMIARPDDIAAKDIKEITRVTPSKVFTSTASWSPQSTGPGSILYQAANIRNMFDQESLATKPPRVRHSSVDPHSLLFSYTPVRRGRMRGTTDIDVHDEQIRDPLRGSVESNDASSSGSISPGSRDQSQKSPSTPSINVHDSDGENRCIVLHNNNNNNNEHKLTGLSHTPIAHMGRPRPSSNTPVFHKRLGELGALKDISANDAMSPEQRRLAESRFPSMERLRSSMQNLHTNDPAERAPSPLLDKFRSRQISLSVDLRDHQYDTDKAPQYRSFNLRKTTEKQVAVLDRLSNLRDKLRHKENFPERSGFMSRGSSMASVRGHGASP